jgi:hypothetical protein
MGNNSYIENKCQYYRTDRCNVVRSGRKAFEFYSGIILVRGSLTKILAFCVLTPSSVESAYKHASGIYCCYLQG